VKKINYKIILKKNDLIELRKKIKSIVFETKPFNKKLFSKKFWIWQYKKLPSKKSYIFGAYHNKKLIGYIHVPIFNFLNKGKILKSCCIQEVAIQKEFRKLKVFTNLCKFGINYLRKEKIKVIYSFPNHKSIKTFVNLKFAKVLQFKLYILPLQFLNRKKIKIYSSKYFKKEFENCNYSFIKKHSSGILRDNNYFYWRYDNCPKANYNYFYIKTKKSISAFIVTRTLIFFGIKFIIIMDYAAKNDQKLIELLKYLKINKNLKGIFFLIFSGNFYFLNELLRNLNVIKVPGFLNFRKVNYMIRFLDKNKKINKNFLTNFSDWDVL